MKHKFIEYERRCLRDGTVWFVPEALHDEPKKPSLGDRIAASGERMTAVGGRGSSAHSTRVAAQTMARATLLAPYLQARRCPTCGSEAFTERKIKGKR